MVKGTTREVGNYEKSYFTGLGKVSLVAACPTRSQLNKLLNKEDSDDDKEIEYAGEDKEGNRKVRLVFWLYCEAIATHVPYSINLIDKVRLNKAGDKVQVINSTLGTSWVPLVDEEPDYSALQDWFTEFQDKEKNVLGKKEYRAALVGEEELGSLMRIWLGRLNWNSPEANGLLDTNQLFNEDFSELQTLIDSDFDTDFVATYGVRTDEEDSTKQYQQIYKNFLPEGFMKNIEKGFKGASSYITKTWQKYEADITGEYGFNAYFTLDPIGPYNREDDPAVGDGKKEEVSDTNSKF